GRKLVTSTRPVKNSVVGLVAVYSGSSATSVRTAIWLFATSNQREFSRSSAIEMNSNAASGFLEPEPMASVQPPDMLTAPGSCPSWVGMGAVPISSDHSGHGATPDSSQLPATHEPSSAMLTLPSGSHSACTVLPMLVSSACCGVGARPSPKTVSTNPSASTKPCDPVTHLPSS